MAMQRVLAISGSLRAKSYNTRALKFAKEIAPPTLQLELFDIREIPPYDEDVRRAGFPPIVEALRNGLKAAAGVLISTPEYNRSIPGVLKNAIDWTSRPPHQPWAEKPVAIMGVSTSRFGTARAQHELHKVLVSLDAYILNKPDVMISLAETVFDEDGHPHDKRVGEQISAQLAAFARWIERVGKAD